MSTEKAPANQRERVLRDACAEMDARLRAGADCHAEEWLERHPELGADADLGIELAFVEFVTREERGDGPRPAEWYRRFPQWRERLERRFAAREQERGDDTSIGGSMNVTYVGPPAKDGSPWQEASPPGYEILQQLGHGGMGVVYKARQLGLNRVVALKMIRTGAFATSYELQRFRLEGETVARLQHPNVVQVFEVGNHRGLPYLAMEFVEGGTLADVLRLQRLPPRAAATVTALLARAIHAAHVRGIVHRDLKPANVLLDRHDPLPDCGVAALPARQTEKTAHTSPPVMGNPKITDFGLAKLYGENEGHTAPGAVLGTPTYMAPEQAAGRSRDVGPPADTYALGAILYEMLVGRPPFQADSQVEVLHRVRFEDPLPPAAIDPKLPRDLDVICVKCLRKEPQDRYASAQDLADELERFLCGEPIRTRPVSWRERAMLWVRRRPAVATLLAVSVLLALLVLGQGWWSYLALRSSAREVEASLREALDAVDAMLVEVGDVELADVPLMDQKRRALLEKAGDFFRRFLERHGDSQAVRYEAARAYVRLGEIQSLLGDAGSSETLQTGIDLLATLPEDAGRQGETARARHVLGIHWKDLGRLADAERELGAATRLREALFQHAGDDASRQAAAESWYQLGATHARIPGRLQQAEECYRRAAELQQALPPPAGPIGLARIHNNWGLLHAGKDDQAALASFDRALACFPAGAAAAGLMPAQRRLLARILVNQAATHEHLGQNSEARLDYARAIEVLDELLRTFPDQVLARQDLVAALLNAGDLAAAQGDVIRADAWLERAIQEAQGMIERGPHLIANRQRLAAAWFRIANRRVGQGRAADADAAYRQAVAAFAELVRRQPEAPEHHEEWGKCLLAWSRTLLDLGRSAESRERCLEALRELRSGAKLEPGQPPTGEPLRAATFTLAVICLRLGDHAAAAEAAEQFPAFQLDPAEERWKAALCLARCAGLARDDAQLDPTERERLSTLYGDRAVHWLRVWVESGHGDLQLLLKAEDLQPLRARPDFHEVLKDLRERSQRPIG